MMRIHRERIIAFVIRCYPAPWRMRHGGDARELATALLDDGTAWWGIALSFLIGASRERVLRVQELGVRRAVAAMTVGVGALSLGMLATLSSAGASSTNVVIVIEQKSAAVSEVKNAVAVHHFDISVAGEAVAPKYVGSILSVRSSSASNEREIGTLRGRCADGTAGCRDGLVIPLRYRGSAQISIGIAPSPK